MALHPKQLDILKRLYEGKNREKIQEELNLSRDTIEYFLKELKRQEYIIYEQYMGREYDLALTPKGKVAVENPDFINNITDLGEKLNIEIPALNILNENSQITEENALMLADEIDTSAWKKLKSQDFLDRQAFMKLPIEKRQQILKEQAEATKNYYKEDSEGQEWRNLDLGDIYEYES